MGTGIQFRSAVARPRAVAFADTTNRRDQQSENELWVNCKGKCRHHWGYPRYRPRHAKLFASEGAYVFITGRRQKELEEAAASIGGNVTGVQGVGQYKYISTLTGESFAVARPIPWVPQ